MADGDVVLHGEKEFREILERVVPGARGSFEYVGDGAYRVIIEGTPGGVVPVTEDELDDLADGHGGGGRAADIEMRIRHALNM